MSVQYPNANVTELGTTVEAYVTSVDELYGHYLDSTAGFIANHKLLIEGQERLRSIQQETDLDNTPFFYGHGSPNDPSNRLLHKTTQGEFKRRNAKGGKNHVRAAQLLIVNLFSFWEHEYRPRLAASLGLPETATLKIPLLGDLRLLRQDVLHHKGIVTKEVAAKLAVLTGFEEGRDVVLTGEAIEDLIRRIKGAMDELVVQAGGSDPMHRTLWRIDGPAPRSSPRQANPQGAQVLRARRGLP